METPVHNQVLYEEHLAAMSGYSQRARLKQWLDELGVRYITGKDQRISVLIDDFKQVPANHEGWEPE